eukprot:TRINITY_DN6828_c0_g1_i2.p1 TRINITY_DN6828_c0_g1~~TRINITY_DN6828_c0_g1_i2.p1  ORF type:complete len:425 (+),score=128.98 TRINITY_DN6828_c0_g1_i2:121-1395(+)
MLRSLVGSEMCIRDRYGEIRISTMELLAKAEDNFSQGEFLKAAGNWTRAIKKDASLAEDPLLQMNMCYALLKAHKFPKALEAADASLALDDKSGKAHYRRGLCLIALEQWDNAVSAMTIAQGFLGMQDPDCRSMLENCRYQCRMWHEKQGTECPKSCVGAENPNKGKEEGKENKKPLTEAEVKAEVKRRMAAKLKNEKAQRQHHNAKKINNTLIALREAQKELLTKDKLEQEAALKKLDELPKELQETLASEEDYQKTMVQLKEGDPIPYDAARVQRFAGHELKNICDAAKADSYSQPVAIVLPGVMKAEWGDEGQGVNLLGAFDTAKQQSNTGKWIQNYATETGSHAVMLVVPKSKLLYPKKLDGWACATSGGHYVQMEAKEPVDRRMWFIANGEVTEVDVAANSNLLDVPKAKSKKKGKGKK